MSDLILHHYDISPFAEKIRSLLGYKGLSWQSVDVPIVMPKPDMMALTGGYRNVPVLQIGADIYCDSSLIAAQIERLYPMPALSQKHGVSEQALIQWGESAFWPVVAIALGMGGMPDWFIADRKELAVQPLDVDAMRAEIPFYLEQLKGHLRLLDALLAEGPFIGGETPSQADFAARHPLWATTQAPGPSPFADYPRIVEWMERIAAFGHGAPTPITAEEALAHARNATPAALGGNSEPEVAGLSVGTRIKAWLAIYRPFPIEGILAHVGRDSVAIAHKHDRCGDVMIHVPRMGMAFAAG